MKAVSIKKLAETMDCLFENYRYFLDRNTGQILEINNEYLSIVEESAEDDDFAMYSDWEKDVIKEAIYILENWDDCIELPDRYEINEYRIMEEFSYSYLNNQISNKLSNSISGRSAFRRFKDTVIYLGIDKEWYTYKNSKLCEKARVWCEHNKIPYED